MKKSDTGCHSPLKRADFVYETRQGVETKLLRLKACRRSKRRSIDGSGLQRSKHNVRRPYVDDVYILLPIDAVLFQYDFEQSVVRTTGRRAADFRPFDIGERLKLLFHVKLECRLIVKHHNNPQRRSAQNRRQHGRTHDLADIDRTRDERLNARSSANPNNLDANSLFPIKTQIVCDQKRQRAGGKTRQVNLDQTVCFRSKGRNRENRNHEERYPTTSNQKSHAASYHVRAGLLGILSSSSPSSTCLALFIADSLGLAISKSSLSLGRVASTIIPPTVLPSPAGSFTCRITLSTWTSRLASTRLVMAKNTCSKSYGSTSSSTTITCFILCFIAYSVAARLVPIPRAGNLQDTITVWTNGKLIPRISRKCGRNKL